VAGGQILAFPIDIDRRPYNTLALPCECVILIKAVMWLLLCQLCILILCIHAPSACDLLT